MTQDEITAIAKQAGGMELPDCGLRCEQLIAFNPVALSEFVRLVRESDKKVIKERDALTALLQDILHEFRTNNYKNQTLDIANKIYKQLQHTDKGV